jgi:hypothetical protein
MSEYLNQLRHLSAFVSHQIYPKSSLLLSTFRLLTSGRITIYHLPFIILFSCGLDIEDPTPPSPPVWVQKSLPEEWPERGIDASGTGGIFLEWESKLDENIMTYHIYRVENYDSIGNYELINQLNVIMSESLDYVDTRVVVGTDYLYRLKAEDGSRNFSDYSDPLGYTLLPALPIGELAPNGVTDTLNANRQLSWSYKYNIEMENYCLTVLSVNNELVCRVILNPTTYTGRTEVWIIPLTIQLESDQVYKWRVDTGARYIEGFETAGSESPWATFIYVEE